MRQYHRIQKQFYRICLVSDKDTQTLALVPDADSAYLIVQLLKNSQTLRDGQRIVSFPSVLRPGPDGEKAEAIISSVTDVA